MTPGALERHDGSAPTQYQAVIDAIDRPTRAGDIQVSVPIQEQDLIVLSYLYRSLSVHCRLLGRVQSNLQSNDGSAGPHRELKIVLASDPCAVLCPSKSKTRPFWTLRSKK